jgi:hypothetical protein
VVEEIWRETKKSRPEAGTKIQDYFELGRTTLTIEIFLILFLLAALFLFSELPLLISTVSRLIFLTLLSRFVALLAGLPALLAVSFRIICHD